ncbi:putative leader peptide [Streptomyces sp. NBC_00306]|uniref:putative leader peptide n=1 Tax=Streptomyces sp. NBC_00306 TaxID=2975708 RepID=UPI003FA75737
MGHHQAPHVLVAAEPVRQHHDRAVFPAGHPDMISAPHVHMAHPSPAFPETRICTAVPRTRRSPGRRPPAGPGRSGPRTGVDRCAGCGPGSPIMQPLGDRTVTLVERRHVDLVRVASAICCV